MPGECSETPLFTSPSWDAGLAWRRDDDVRPGGRVLLKPLAAMPTASQIAACLAACGECNICCRLRSPLARALARHGGRADRDGRSPAVSARTTRGPSFPSHFEVLGVTPAAGQIFSADDRIGARRSSFLTLWRRRLGAARMRWARPPSTDSPVVVVMPRRRSGALGHDD